VGKPGLPHAPYGLDAPAQAHWDLRRQLLGRLRVVCRPDLRYGVREFEPLAVRPIAQSFYFADALQALLQQLSFQKDSP